MSHPEILVDYPYSSRFVSSLKYIEKDNQFGQAENLNHACRIGDHYTVARLLNEGVDIESIDTNGFTPLLNAVNNENLSLVSFLINHGANINYYCAQHHCSPLSIASSLGNVPMLHYLLEHGGDITFHDSLHRNLLHLAATSGKTLACEYLVWCF